MSGRIPVGTVTTSCIETWRVFTVDQRAAVRARGSLRMLLGGCALCTGSRQGRHGRSVEMYSIEECRSVEVIMVVNSRSGV